MKRNIAIAALDEIFNDGDVICYADDDDFRTAQYFNDMASFCGITILLEFQNG